jgi:hypothetical protein
MHVSSSPYDMHVATSGTPPRPSEGGFYSDPAVFGYTHVYLHAYDTHTLENRTDMYIFTWTLLYLSTRVYVNVYDPVCDWKRVRARAPPPPLFPLSFDNVCACVRVCACVPSVSVWGFSICVTHMHVRINSRVCMHACVHVFSYASVYACIHVSMYMSLYASVYAWIYVKDEDVLAYIERDKLAKLESAATKQSPMPGKVIIMKN